MTDTDPEQNEEVLNLEAQSFDELDRVPETGSDVVEPTPNLKEPHISRRCESSQREILKNRFAVEEE